MDWGWRSIRPRAICEMRGACRQYWDGSGACEYSSGTRFDTHCARDRELAHLAPSMYLIESVNRNKPPLSLEEIVEGGLCIGCGLCQSAAGADKIRIVLTPEGRERPVARTPLDAAMLKRINAICPGPRAGGGRP